MSFDRLTRRSIIALSAAGVASPLLAQLGGSATAIGAVATGRPMPGNVNLPSTPPARKSGTVGIALVGLGGYALNQMAPAIAASRTCHIAALVSGNPEKARTVAAAYGVPADAIYSYADYDRIARDKRIQAVNIVLPSGLHAEYTVRAFAAGKHVLVEKPMALTPAECTAMIEAGERAKRKLMVGYRVYFEPFNVRAMELMRAKALGDLRVIRTDNHYVIGTNGAQTNWRLRRALAGSGALEDFGLYGLQAALYLSDEMPYEVSAAISTPRDHPAFFEIDNLVTAQLRFPSGMVAQLSTSYNASGANRVEVRGNGGVLTMEPATSYSGQAMRLSGTGANDGPINPGDPRVQFVGMVDHFGDAILKDTPILPTGAMGLRDVRLIDAILRAGREGRTIRLNPDATMA